MVNYAANQEVMVDKTLFLKGLVTSSHFTKVDIRCLTAKFPPSF